MAAFAFTIFTGAFLLFQVQPLIGKYILPWFGGGPGVWTVCMLFFQVVLLGGYAYAHVISRWLKPRSQIILHSVLLAAAMAFIPIIPSDGWKPAGDANPLLAILALLAATLGLPYFVLSATGPLMQEWFRLSNPGRSPYRLYALSNAGSLLALVTYPFYFETHFPRKTQAGLWAVGLLLYALGCVGSGRKLWRTAGAGQSEAPLATGETGPASHSQTSLTTRLLWLLLPACASVLLLATTNKMCQDVAVIPFLWVLPLALYLLSFIVCFDSPRWYRRFPFAMGLVAALFGLCWALFHAESASIQHQVTVYCGSLFICCMVCHGELFRLRPTVRGLTGYYLSIAAGGALGGIFVAVAAPLVFTSYYELPCGIMFCAVLFLAVCVLNIGAAAKALPVADNGMDSGLWADSTRLTGKETPRSPSLATRQASTGVASISGVGEHNPGSSWPAASPSVPVGSAFARLWGWLLSVGCWRWLGCTLPILGFAGLDWLVTEWRARLSQGPVAHQIHIPAAYFIGLRIGLWGLLAAAAGWWMLRRKYTRFQFWRLITCAWLGLGCLALGEVLWSKGRAPDTDVVYRSRNFYGVLTIYEHFKGDPEDDYLLLQHGRITHGLQFTHPPRDRWAVSYYGEGSGISLGVNALPARNRRIGVVGLGTGTLTALGHPGDYFRIYEINSQVREIAWNRFSYLRNLTNSGGAVEVVMGDARLSMEREPPQQFDLLALDAFSSDSIPLHLLTREAFDLYQRHLRTNGVVVVHISNHYLDLEPVVVNLAREFHYQVSLVDFEEDEESWWMYSNTWMVLTRDQGIIDSPGIKEGVSAVTAKHPKVPLWTDDFASLFPILR